MANPIRLKQFFKEIILNRLLADQVVTSYLFFWARLVIRLRRPFVIAITGSAGKTTTTETIAAVLASPAASRVIGPSRSTVRNMNNDIGLPLTILQYDRWLTRWPAKRLLALYRVPLRAAALAISPRYPRILILEYGTHWKGHLHKLVALAPPNIGIVTTIGPAHLERLKTIAGVVHEKSAVVAGVAPSGLVILGDGHDYVAELEGAARAPVIKVSGRGIELSFNIARVVGRHLGIPDEATAEALAAYKPAKGRLTRIETNGISLIDDSYNANPLSMKLGLDTLTDSAATGQRRVAILGSMGELGEQEKSYHRDIGVYARSRCDMLIGVGELAREYSADKWFENSEACAQSVHLLVRTGDCVLVKGSASVRMRVVVGKICQPVSGIE